MKTYWFNIKHACGAVSTDEKGVLIYKDTAPIFLWAVKKKMNINQLINYYKSKWQYISHKEI